MRNERRVRHLLTSDNDLLDIDDLSRWHNGDRATSTPCRRGITPNSSNKSPLSLQASLGSVQDSSSLSRLDSPASSNLALLASRASSSNRQVSLDSSSNPSPQDFPVSSCSLSRPAFQLQASNVPRPRQSLQYPPFLPNFNNSNSLRMCRPAGSSVHSSLTVS